MKASQKKSKADRLRSAAIVKLKYQMLSGRMDPGFQTVFDGVLADLALQEGEVDRYIEEHRDELEKLCLESG